MRSPIIGISGTPEAHNASCGGVFRLRTGLVRRDAGSDVGFPV